MLLTGSHTFPETQAPSRQNQRGIIVPHFAVSSMKLGALPGIRPRTRLVRGLMPGRCSVNVYRIEERQQTSPSPWGLEHGPEDRSLSHLGQGLTFGLQVLASPGCGEFPPRDHLLCRPDVPAEARPSGGNGLEGPGCWVSRSPPAPCTAFVS